jgi:hypothetical protein
MRRATVVVGALQTVARRGFRRRLHALHARVLAARLAPGYVRTASANIIRRLSVTAHLIINASKDTIESSKAWRHDTSEQVVSEFHFAFATARDRRKLRRDRARDLIIIETEFETVVL